MNQVNWPPSSDLACPVLVHQALARVAACHPQATIRLGVLVNGHARQMAGAVSHRRLRRSLGAENPIVTTKSIAHIDAALQTLLCDRGVNILAIAGGDGTVHHVVNALLDLQKRHEISLKAHVQRSDGPVSTEDSHTDPADFSIESTPTSTSIPLPHLLILNGGTLNIIGRTAGLRGSPSTILRRFLQQYAHRCFSQLPVRTVPLLAVSRQATSPFEAVRYGFVFGSETLFHSIELYVSFGAGYAGLVRFLMELARGATVGSRLWREEGWKLGPFNHPLSIDGRPVAVYTAVVASTVDLTLAVAAIRAIKRRPGAIGFHVKIVRESDPLVLVRQVPSMMSARSVAGIEDVAEAHQLALWGPYTLDGECFAEATDERTPLHVRSAEYAVRLVCLAGVADPRF